MTEINWDELEKNLRQPIIIKTGKKLDKLLTVYDKPVPVPDFENPGPSKADIAYMMIRRGAKTLLAAVPAAAGIAAVLTVKGVSLPIAAGAGGISAIATALGAAGEKGYKELRVSKGKKPIDLLTSLLKLIKLLLEFYINYRTRKPKGG